MSAFEDITTIQFNHRMFAYLLFILINGFAFGVYRHVAGRARLAAVLLVLALLLQVTLDELATLIY